ncbi:hypothetical protein BH23PLA1_BH23PLA1_16090 [soil metagenome]
MRITPIEATEIVEKSPKNGGELSRQTIPSGGRMISREIEHNEPENPWLRSQRVTHRIENVRLAVNH